MANNTNNVTLVGNVTRDPELRYTASGQAMAKFGLAVNRSWQNRQTNEWEESTSFFDVVVWREMAENVGDSVSKGTRVIVTGRMEQRSYETQNGEKRSAVELVADEVGPSLRFATAKVERNERRGADEGGGRFGGTSGSSGRSQPSEPSYPDEEPF
jgi:single-strand DNA-binding protein